MAENIGTKFDDFIILKILKRSEYKNKQQKIILYGFVAKVKSKLDNNIYSMKKIDLSLLANKEEKKYYENEYKMVKGMIKSNFKHENVYRPVSYFQEEKTIYIITEYIDGENLLDFYNWHKKNKIGIEEEKLAKIFIQCLRGLKYIHDKGIIHRTIKLDNIVIDSNDIVKIINFKYAIKKVENDFAKVNIGIYTSPDIKKGKYDEKVDVFSLGVVFNCLTDLRDKLPGNKEKYSKDLYTSIKYMKEGDLIGKFSAEEIYRKLKNNYYNLMDACLGCFLFNFKEDLLKFQASNDNDIEMDMIDLAAKCKDKDENTDLKKVAIKYEEKFYEKGYSFNDFSPTNITNFLWSLIPYKKRLIIKDNISNTFEKISLCSSCNKETSLMKKKTYFINFNRKNLEDEIGNIKNLFEKLYSGNKKQNPFYEICEKCKKKEKMMISSKYIKLAKNLIIFIEDGFKFLKPKDLSSVEDYELKSIIVKDKHKYDYYNKDIIQYTKNEEWLKKEGAETFTLDYICKQDIIALYYCGKENINNNVSNSQAQTVASSMINGQANLNEQFNQINNNLQNINNNLLFLANNLVPQGNNNNNNSNPQFNWQNNNQNFIQNQNQINNMNFNNFNNNNNQFNPRNLNARNNIQNNNSIGSNQNNSNIAVNNFFKVNNNNK